MQNELERLENEYLVRPLADAEPTYQFQHALIQDAVYATLLKNDRRELHYATAQAIETLHADQLDNVAALLAYHYDQAEHDERAIAYSLRAANHAARVYANAEAVEHYTRAIALGEQHGTAFALPYLERGRLYERAGRFDAARHDLEHALELARARRDLQIEWQCLMELGLLWSARNYDSAGEYFETALERAIDLGNLALIAHSMNRLGNRYINAERVSNALDYHQRALELFQTLNDRQGLAATYDLLAVCMMISGDTVASADYYQQAMGLFRELDDRRGLASSLATFGFLHRNYGTDLVVTRQTFAESAAYMDEALRRSQEIGWRAGESFTCSLMGITYASQGLYAQALDYAARGLRIAEAIQHDQWIVSAVNAMGMIFAELLEADYAQRQFERSVALARAIHSVYWRRLEQAWLAITCISQQDYARAHAILAQELDDEMPMQTMSQRRLWSARVLLALAERESALALELSEKLIASGAHAGTQVIPLLAYLQGRALAQLGAFERAEHILRAALGQAQRENVRPLIWRLYGALSGAQHGMGERATAAETLAAARRQIRVLSEAMPAQIRDVFTGELRPLRENFLTRALARTEQLYAGQ